SCPGGAQLDPDVSLVACVLIFIPNLRNAISHFCLHKNENTSQELADKSERSQTGAESSPATELPLGDFLAQARWVLPRCHCQKSSSQAAAAGRLPAHG
ncbi:unnamed protein product, partial [Bubo scandiacus]